MNRSLSIFGILVLLSALSGCGGSGAGGSASPAQRAGRLSLTIVWPKRTSRFIPSEADSIMAQVTDSGGTPISGQSQLLARPTSGNSVTTQTFTGLPPGSVMLEATAFPNADGSGVAQAAGASPATIVAGQTANVTVTMASTITKATITPPAPSVAVGASSTLTVTYQDASNNTVLVNPAFVTWRSSSSNATVATAAGLTTSLTGVTVGSNITITVSDSESGGNIPNGTATATVTNAAVTLAAGGWPKFGADLQNSGVQPLATVSRTRPSVVWSTVYQKISNGNGPGPEVVVSPNGNTLYVAATLGAFYSLNATDGSENWKLQTQTTLGATAALGSNGVIYFTGANQVFAVSASSGQPVWSYLGRNNGAPTFASGGILVAPSQSASNGVTTLNAATGAFINNLPRDVFGNLGSPPMSPNDKVAVTLDASGNVKGDDLTTGQPIFSSSVLTLGLFSMDTSGNAYSPEGGNVELVHGLTPAGADLYDATAYGRSNPVVGPDKTIYVEGKNPDLTSNDPLVVTAISSSGTVKWTANVAAGTSASEMAMDGNGVLIVAYNHQEEFGPEPHLTAIDTKNNGAILWDLDVLGVGVDGDTQVSFGATGVSLGPDGSIYVVSNDGTIFRVK